MLVTGTNVTAEHTTAGAVKECRKKLQQQVEAARSVDWQSDWSAASNGCGCGCGCIRSCSNNMRTDV